MSIEEPLVAFLRACASPYHVVKEMASFLESKGFSRLRESQPFPTDRKPYYYVRDGTSLVAFRRGRDLAAGFSSILAHTDSPVLRVLQTAPLHWAGTSLIIPMEPYSGPVLSRWLDRPLRLAGRVSYLFEGKPHTLDVDVENRCFIPGLAPHMLRGDPGAKDWVPEGADCFVQLPVGPDSTITVNGEMISVEMVDTFSAILRRAILKKLNPSPDDCQRVNAAIEITAVMVEASCPEISVLGDTILAGRMDNLLSCFSGSRAIADAVAATKDAEDESADATLMFVAFNNEEIGSGTRAGAKTAVPRNLFARLCGGENEVFFQGMAKSFGLSADAAHAKHYIKGAAAGHTMVEVAGGICLKTSQKQNYAFTDEATAVAISCAARAGVPIVNWVGKSYAVGGGTIGNLCAVANDLRVADAGVPMHSMHSCCESASLATVQEFGAFCKSILLNAPRVLQGLLDELEE